MKPERLLLLCLALVVLLQPQPASSQPSIEQTGVPRIAVLRMKGVGVTDATRELLSSYARLLQENLGRTDGVIAPPWASVEEAIDDEGVEPEGLIDLDDCIDAAEALGLDRFVIGTIEHRTMTLSNHVRVYSMPEADLVGVADGAMNEREADKLAGQIAARVVLLAQQETPERHDHSGFTWSQRFSFSFGTERYDLEPPTIHYINNDPPFEIGVKVAMDRLFGMYVATHFEIFVDGEAIATITPDIDAPRPIREQEVMIGGEQFCFQATVVQLRTRDQQAIQTAVVDINAKACPDE